MVYKAYKYKTIANHAMSELKEKSSKFISYAIPIQSEEQAGAAVAALWKEHPKATHVCYAYAVGVSREITKLQDDGEPSGTAAKPILGQILSKDLTDVIVCVVRYYGGIKLGTSGLIAAYKGSAQMVLDQAEIVVKNLFSIHELKSNYEQMGHVLNVLKSLDVNILEKNFTDIVLLKIGIPLEDEKSMLIKLKARLLGIEEERVGEDTQIDFCTFTPLQIVKQ